MTKNAEILGNTPYRSTGYVNTRDNSLRALVDWVSVTFKRVKNWQKITKILGIENDKFKVTNQGYLGYQKTARFENIMIAFDPAANTVGMGVHLSMNGKGCRQYEEIYKNNKNVWSDLFLLIVNEEHKFSRLDLAVDDFKGYFTINQVYSTAKRGCLVAKRIQTARDYEELFLDTGETKSRTFYVGKSNWMIRFYDKLQERTSKGFTMEEDVKVWNRYELQLRNEIATSAGHVIAFEHYELGEFVKGFMAEKIDFKVKNKTDSNRSRWKTTTWWSKFLKDVEKIPLTQISPDPSIPRIHNWLDTQVNTSLITYLEAFDYDPTVIKFLSERAKDKMDHNKQKIIDDFKNDEELKKEMLKFMREYLLDKKNNI